MSQISGFRRTLSHANSMSDQSSVPRFGVITEKETDLAEVRPRFTEHFDYETSIYGTRQRASIEFFFHVLSLKYLISSSNFVVNFGI